MSLTVDQRLDFLEKRQAIVEGGLAKLLEELSVLNGEIEAGLAKTPTQASQNGTAGFSPEELDALPWKVYASNKGAWVFSRQQDGTASMDPVISRLVGKLEKEGPLKIHGRRYLLSGEKRQFLARFPP